MFSSKPLIAIFCIIFVDVLAFTLVLPYLPFFAERFGATPFEIGLIITVFSLFQFLSGPILGRMSDQMGRKPLLILSQIGTCLGFIILGFANSIWMVYFARILDGATAGNLSVAQAAIADVTKPQERAKAFSMIGIAFGTGFFIGPAISGFLIHFGPQAPAFGAAFISFISILTTAFLFKDAPHVHQDKKPFRISKNDLANALSIKPILYFLRQPQIKPLLLQFLFFNLSFTAHISCFALFAERRLQYNGAPFGAKEVSYLYAYLGMMGILIRSIIIDKLIARFGQKGTARIGFAAQGIGYLSYAFVHTIPGAVLAATIASVGSSVIRPTVAAQMSRSANPKEMGELFGVSQSIASIASIIAPLAAGFLIGHSPLSYWAIFSGASVLLAFFFNQPRDAAPAQAKT